MSQCLRPFTARGTSRRIYLHAGKGQPRPLNHDVLLQRRNFRATESNRIFESLVYASHDTLQAVHSLTGLPWAASIPLTSILVRTILVSPLQYLSFSSIKKERDLIPLMATWRNKFQQEVIEEEKKSGTKFGPEKAEKMVQERQLAKSKEIYDRPRIYTFSRFIPLLQLPMWLSFMDAIRCMSGQSSRLLKSEVTNGDAGQSLVPLEPTFGSEGTLWFSNLLVYDSTHMLPILIGLGLLYSINENAILKWLKLRDRDVVMSRRSNWVTRFLSLLALSMPYMAYVRELPSAMMIYWVSGTVFSIFQRPVLEKLVGIKPVFTPPKRSTVVLKHNNVRA